MRHTIQKKENGLWEVEWEDGTKSQHSTQEGAERMVRVVNEKYESKNPLGYFWAND